jgi:uncharacterized protein
MYEALGWIALAAGFVLAFVGTILPGLPGSLFIVLGAIAHMYLVPGMLTWTAIIVLGVLAIASWIADFMGGAVGAKLGGATKAGLIGATIGGAFGIFLGPAGLIVGPFIGAVVGDMYAKRRDIAQLIKSGAGASVGFFISLFLRLGLLFAQAIAVLVALLV